MRGLKGERDLSLVLSREEALVLFEWIARFNKEQHSGMFQDAAEEKVLWDLEALLEKNVDEAFATNYAELLLKARRAIRNKE